MQKYIHARICISIFQGASWLTLVRLTRQRCVCFRFVASLVPPRSFVLFPIFFWGGRPEQAGEQAGLPW